MARTNEWTECLVDWVDGRLRQNRFSNMWLGGGAGADGGSSYRPIDGQLTQRHVCYDTSEDVSPCSPSGFSSLVDNLRRIRYWQEPATWFGAETTSGLKITIKPGLWYPSTTEYCAFTGGDSPTFTLPAALDRIDTVYIDPSGILHIQRGTPAVSPTITLPPIASGIPLWAVYLPPTASGVYFQVCSGYYAGQAYIERDLRPFLNLGGGAAASGVPNATAEGQALVSNAALEWIADTTPLWKGEHSFEASIAFIGVTTENSITIPDAQTQALHIIDTGGTEFLRIDTYNEYFLIDPAGVGIKVGIGVATPNQKLTIEGTIDLKEQAAANADTATYGQIWVKNTTPCELWFTDDTGTDVQLGLAGGGLPNVAGAGYVIVSTGIDAWAADQTPLWTGEHSFEVGISFVGVSGANEITVPDNTAIALELLDAGGLEYMRVVSTNANPYLLIDPGATGFKVGIGCTPNYLLDTSGANPVYTRILSDGTTAGFLLTSSTRTWALKTSTNLFIIRDVTGGQDRVIINTTGFGIGAEAGAPLDVTTSTATTNTYVDVVHIEAVSTGDMADGFGPRINFAIRDGAVATQHIASLIARRDGADNTGGLLFVVKNAGAWNYTALWVDPTGDVGVGISTPDGTMHVWTATAGAVAAHSDGDDLTVENSASGGISILVPNASDANLFFGSPSDNLGALIRWEYNELRMMVGTAHTNGVLSLRSGNAVEAIRIEADGDTFFNGGDVGIGVSPTYRLDVKDDVAGGFVAKFFNDGDNVNRYGILVQAGADNGAAVGSTFYFYATDGDGNVTGDLLTTNGVFQLQDVSDRDRKTKIKNTEIVGLDIINGLQVRDYNWKVNPKGPVMTSFVAQEAQKVFPAMIGESPDGILMTARAMLIPVIAKAIQELDVRLTQGGL